MATTRTPGRLLTVMLAPGEFVGAFALLCYHGMGIGSAADHVVTARPLVGRYDLSEQCLSHPMKTKLQFGLTVSSSLISYATEEQDGSRDMLLEAAVKLHPKAIQG